jgi:2-hydroxy-3-keto-5-methylthiopentenyl-1-phosphate phosphatase
MKAFVIHDAVINEEETVTVMDPDLRNLNTDTVMNPMAIWSELRNHMDKDILNPKNLYNKDFFNQMFESEHQSELDIVDFSRENSKIDESFKSFA